MLKQMRVIAVAGAVGGSVFVTTASGQVEVMTYEGWSHVSVLFEDHGEIERLLSTSDVRLLSESASLTAPTELLMRAELAERFILSGSNMRILDDDIGPEVELMRDVAGARGFGRVIDPDDPAWFDDYRSGDEIIAFWDNLAVRFPGFVSKETIGASVFGEPIYGYTVSAPGVAAGEKPGVCFFGMQHSREWISPAVVTYVMDKMLVEYGVESDATSALDNVSWYVIPLMNPDGYEYSRITDRFWRKNRRDNGDGTFGVDLNRNWGTNFSGPGSSPFTSNDTYHGLSAFSEPETRAGRDFLLGNPNIVAHIDWHSFSQLILWPIGFSAPLQAPLQDRIVLESVGVAMSESIEAQSGELYVPQKASSLYVASGVASDWAYVGAGVMSWTFELRPDRANGLAGFDLPPEEIVPSGEENYEAVLTLAEAVLNPLYIERVNEVGPVVSPGAIRPTVVNAVASFGEELDPSSVRLNWSVDTGSYTSVVGRESADGVRFRMDIPAQLCGSTVSYYYEASTVNGQRIVLPEGAPANVFRYRVAEEELVLEEAFESGTNGWQAGVAGDTATAGIWELANPAGTAAQPEDDATDAGLFAFITDGAGGTLSNADVDGGFTTLLSPVFDLSGAEGAGVSYSRWYSNDQGSSPNSDTFRVDVSDDGGATWKSLEVVGPAGEGTSGGWISVTHSVGDVVSLTDGIRFRFIAEDAGEGSIIEAGIDEFRLSTFERCCVGDANLDSRVDIEDLLSVLRAFGESGVEADVTGNGAVDIEDLLLVLRVFGSECD